MFALDEFCYQFPFPTPHITYCSCQFDVVQFNDTAFSFYNIPCPTILLRAVPKRKAEFLAGRFCAMKALSHLCGEEYYVAINPDRSPKWPEGVVGSITHSGKTAATVVAKKSEFIGLGIDYEETMTLEQAEQLQGQILTEPEQHLISSLTIDMEAFVTLVFSAKESLYKALYPVVKQFLNFHDFFIEEFTDETLILSLCKTINKSWLIGTEFEVFYRFNDGHIMTCVSLRG